MASVFADATLFVFPTRHPEGTPRVLIEAGASGLPSVVSGQPGCHAVVEHDVTGIVLGAKPSVTELANAVEQLASDAIRAAAMGRTARSRVAGTYSMEAVLGQLLNWKPVGAVSR
jgi:glycosyltransferase involved in cell wall biosynthesis